MVSKKLICLEDEEAIANPLCELLRKWGHTVDWCKKMTDAKNQMNETIYHLAIIDVGLPDGNGFDFAAWMREFHPLTAILFLTAFDSADDRVRGLEIGAEDYVCKPFSFREIKIRIDNILKRVALIQSDQRILKLGETEFDISKFSLNYKGHKFNLSHKEAAMLKLLVDHKGQVITRDEFLNQIWSPEEFPTTRTIDNFILRLRKYLSADDLVKNCIQTIRGKGYVFELH